MVSRILAAKQFVCTTFLFLVFLCPVAANAATLVVDNGKLVGAQGVSVNGQLLDVSFIDGSCVDVFSGGDNVNNDFFFSTKAGAAAASLALMDQVFLDTGGGEQFDSSPQLTAGCSSSIRYLLHVLNYVQV